LNFLLQILPNPDVQASLGIDPYDVIFMKTWIQDLESSSSSSSGLSSRFACLVTLVLLWQSSLKATESHCFVSQLASIRDRYQLYLRDELTQEFGTERADAILYQLLQKF
jgi:hypothetical protein